MKNGMGLLAMIIMLFASNAQAQLTDKGGFSFAVMGGVNFQNINGKDASGDRLENDLITGFHAGVQARIPLVPGFYIQPGVLYSTKGAKNTDGEINSTYNLAYIEVPLNLVFRATIGLGSVYVGFGPYVAYGIGGTSTYDIGSVSDKSDIEFQNTVELNDPLLKTYIKPVDAGGNIFFGFELGGGLFAQVNAQLGMLNIHPDDKRIINDETSLKNTGFGLSAGYRF